MSDSRDLTSSGREEFDPARELIEQLRHDPRSSQVWESVAQLVASTDVDVEPLVALVDSDHAPEVLRCLQHADPNGVDVIADVIWARNPGDARVLTLVPTFAARLHSVRAMEWSARMRTAGMGRTCPLLERAGDPGVPALERVRAAALAHASFGDRRARELVERACHALADDEIVVALLEVHALAPAFGGSVVVNTATTPQRSLVVAAALFDESMTSEAYAALVHGLSMEGGTEMSREDILQLLPLGVLHGLAGEAENRGEHDIAGMLEALLVVGLETVDR